jgi:inward rectifier potassium channel
MAGHNRQQRLKDINNTGFGANSNVEGGRLINPDGTTNLRKRGIPFWERISIYHTLLRMPRGYFLLCIFLFYTTLNLIFASLYMIIGVEHLLGVEGVHSFFTQFEAAFFFSSQTLTTVGYGHIAPSGTLTNALASLESLSGIISFGVVTGLIYGRFSRPQAYLLFSKNMLVSPYQDGKALMVRIATYKNNHLTDVEAQLNVALHVPEQDKTVTKFYQLKLEIAKINSLALSWTIVHQLTEDSPLYGMTREDIENRKMEVIVIIKAFDDHFSNIVQQRTSYTYQQIVYGAKFLPMFERAPEGDYTLLELDKINTHEPARLPEAHHLIGN